VADAASDVDEEDLIGVEIWTLSAIGYKSNHFDLLEW
jgi:hypothetical protein